MTCSIIVSNKDTYFYSFMSKDGAVSVTAFREMAHHIWHVGRMRFVSHETNLVFLWGHLVYHVLQFLLPSL